MVKYKDLVQEDHTSASKNWLILFSKNNPCHKHLQKLIMNAHLFIQSLDKYVSSICFKHL